MLLLLQKASWGLLGDIDLSTRISKFNCWFSKKVKLQKRVVRIRGKESFYLFLGSRSTNFAISADSWESKDYNCTTRFQMHFSPSLRDVLPVWILYNVSLTDEVQSAEKMLSKLFHVGMFCHAARQIKATRHKLPFGWMKTELQWKFHAGKLCRTARQIELPDLNCRLVQWRLNVNEKYELSLQENMTNCGWKWKPNMLKIRVWKEGKIEKHSKVSKWCNNFLRVKEFVDAMKKW